MRERPIIFSAPMVRAILDDRKTQTRRVVQLPHQNPLGAWEPTGIGGPNGGRTVAGNTIPEQGAIWHTRTGECIACPYGAPGGRLWVRENGWERPALSARDLRDGADTWPPYEYDAEPLMSWEDGELKRLGWRRRPSIHMPRWASRITLEIESVRVERLQDISEADAEAEGVRNSLHLQGGRFARDNFAHLWWTINGDGSWEANPWVWVVSFRRITP